MESEDLFEFEELVIPSWGGQVKPGDQGAILGYVRQFECHNFLFPLTYWFE